MGYTVMTSVQQLSVPAVLGGGDVLIQSQTGSGKPHNIDHSPLELFYTVSHKTLPPFLCQILTDFQNVCTAGKRVKFATNPYHIIHLTLGMLLYYLGKLKIQFLADIQQIWKQMQTNCIVSALILISVRV